MMVLSTRHHDGLTEVINIAFGRTAAALSELTGQRVMLSVPRVTVHPIEDLAAHLGEQISGEVATVHQIFAGPLVGDALLLLPYPDAVLLTGLLMDEDRPAGRLTASAREVLTEVGNILLNACLGLFGDLLRVRISFALPRVHVDQLTELLTSLQISRQGLRAALVVTTAFHLRETAVGGYMVIVLGIVSLDRLLAHVDRLG